MAGQYRPPKISLVGSQKLTKVEPVSRGTNNLFQASKKYNLVFHVVVNEIYVFRPSYPTQKLPSEPLRVLNPNPGRTEVFQVGINNLHVGELGSEEVLISAHEDGKFYVWYTRDLNRPVFSASVKVSAWGISTHKESRRVAISANNYLITVFELGLTKNELEFRRDHFGESDLDVEPEGYHNKRRRLDQTFSEEGEMSWELPEESEDKKDEDRTKDAWKVVFQKQAMVLRGHGHNIPCISFLPDRSGRWLSSASIDGSFKIWDIDAEAEVASHSVTKTWAWSVVGLSPDSFYETESLSEALGVVNPSQEHQTLDGASIYDITPFSRNRLFHSFIGAAQGFSYTMGGLMHHGIGEDSLEDDDEDDDDDDDDANDDGSDWESDEDEAAQFYDIHDDYDMDDVDLEFYLNQQGSDEDYGEIWAGGGESYIDDEDDDDSIPDSESVYTADEEPPPLEPVSSSDDGNSEASHHSEAYHSDTYHSEAYQSLPPSPAASDAEPPGLVSESMDIATDSENEEFHFDAPPDLISSGQSSGHGSVQSSPEESESEFQNPASWPELGVVFEDDDSQEEYWSDEEMPSITHAPEPVQPNPDHLDLPKPEPKYPPTSMPIFAGDQRQAYIYQTTLGFQPTTTCNPFLDQAMLTTFSPSDKINMTAYIPELSLVFAASKSRGKVAVFRLTRFKKLLAFRLDKVLPSAEDDVALTRMELAGLDVQPIQGMEIEADSMHGRERWRGVDMSRRWRLWVSYINGHLLCYDVVESKDSGDILFV